MPKPSEQAAFGIYPQAGKRGQRKPTAKEQLAQIFSDERAMDLPKFGEVDLDVPSAANRAMGQRMVERDVDLKRQADRDMSPLEKIAGGMQTGRLIGSGLVNMAKSIPTAITKGGKAAEEYIAENIYKPTVPKAYEYAEDIGNFLQSLESDYKIPPIIPEAMMLQNVVGPATRQGARNLSAPRTLNPQAGVFVGPKAKTWNKGKADMAVAMEEAGRTPQEIWQATGTFRGADGILRQEIDDRAAKLILPDEQQDRVAALKGRVGEMKESIKPIPQKDLFPKALTEAKKGVRSDIDALKEEISGRSRNARTQGIDAQYAFEHPELYEAYPELRNLNITMGGREGTASGASGALSVLPKSDKYPGHMEMDMYNRGLMSKNPTSVALHEMQHAIQTLEGMGPGGSPTMAFQNPEAHEILKQLRERAYKPASFEDFQRVNKYPEAEAQSKYIEYLNQVQGGASANPTIERALQERAAMEYYKRLAGEAEARAVQDRQMMTPQQRMQYPPASSYDVPQEDLIIKPPREYADGGPVHFSDNPDVMQLELASGGGVKAALKAAKGAAKAAKPPQEKALLLAQQRAALPTEKGGLGLPANNTPEQRAKAMGINTDAYHGTKQDITGAFKPGYDDNLAFVTKSPDFANKWIGKGKLQQRAGEQAQQEVKSAEDAYREMKSRNMNYDNALNDLKGEEFDAEYDRRSALARAEAEAEFGSPGYPDKIHSTVYPLKVEANRTFNPETDMDVMAEFFEKNEIPPKVQELYASGNYMMYETKPVVEYLKSKGYDSMRLRESTGDDYPTIAVFNPETTRSRFAAFDPFRKDAATAAAMGVLAPDLLAKERDEDKKKDKNDKKADGGAVQMAGGGALSKLAKAAKPAPMKASEALGRIEGRPLVITQSDRTKVGGGLLGGPGFSGLQLTEPEYRAAEAVWGVKTPGVAKMIIGGGKKAGADPVYTTFIGTPNQHQPNQMVFDKLLGDFKKSAKKGGLDPELQEKINYRLANAVDKDGRPIFPPDVDILDKNFRNIATTFDQRAVTSSLIGGFGVGGKKGQIIDYDKIIRNTTDPALIDVPSGALGNRLFTLSGGIIDRPDLHPAFPTILQGEDLGVSFEPVIRDLVMKDFIEKTMREKGRPPGYMDYTRGHPPSQLITEDILTEMQKMGKKAGGAVRKAAGGEITADDLILEERKL